MFILQFAMFDRFANNITHRIFISPGIAPARGAGLGRVVLALDARGDAWSAKSLGLQQFSFAQISFSSRW
ncbi:hypothetical protein LF1_00590 [Rubripirellula obstinata]|uniref:Uncharacterized protein n=1 Tax=Rubripirellula obstinata TaxID=406547 RepID=A0A5B1CBI6_9BACT|nr:hypothetical protein LF1_00590 [Rubripirellula obstinata]